MPDTSHILSLPLIQPSQAQKHVTHNEALRMLDAIVQLVVLSATETLPPDTVTPGARYIVGASAGGAWAGHTGEIAVFDAGYWRFVTPQPGWQAQVLTPAQHLVFQGEGGWQVPALTSLGINATADSVNRLSLSAPATLFNHEGAGHQVKLNKAQDSDTASLLYQTNFSGRAEVGLVGSDDLAIKVSQDGGQWREALRISAQSGTPSFPQGIQSRQTTVPTGGVTAIAAPTNCGFALLSVVSERFPQGSASMVVCYDVGDSPELSLVWAGSRVTNLGAVLPDGSTAPAGNVGVAVQANGRIYLENRHSSGNTLQYCITWINGWEALAS